MLLQHNFRTYFPTITGVIFPFSASANFRFYVVRISAYNGGYISARYIYYITPLRAPYARYNALF